MVDKGPKVSIYSILIAVIVITALTVIVIVIGIILLKSINS